MFGGINPENTQLTECQSGPNQLAVMFSSVKYRAIDYVCEASARHGMMMSLLTLPLPLPLGDPVYLHSGHLRDKAFRSPWMRGILSSACRLEVPGCALDDLKPSLCSGDFLERFGVCVAELDREFGEVVPSSNPASQGCVGAEEALWLLGEGDVAAECGEWRETFTLHAEHPSCLSYQDLVLPEEVIVTDPLVRFKTRMPSFLSLMQRLKTLPVSDPLQSPSGVILSEHVIFRHCAPYEATCDEPHSCSGTLSVTEDFKKESILSAEFLMLPVGIEAVVVQKPDLILSTPRLQESLKVSPEAIEEQRSVLDTMREDTSAGVLRSSACEMFSVPVCDSDNKDSESTYSPVPYKTYVEMEIEPPLSPPDRPVQPELSLSTNQLSAEQLSPDYRQVLLRDHERDVMEKAVWLAEKHPESFAGLILAEPQMCARPVSVTSLPELILLLGAEKDDAAPVTDAEAQQGMAPLSPAWCLLGEAMTVDARPASETTADSEEQFHPLSIAQIDELLRDSAESAVEGLLPGVKGASVLAQVTGAPNRVKTVKFILVEETTSQDMARYDHTNSGVLKTGQSITPDALSHLEKNTQKQLVTNTPNTANHPAHLSQSTLKKRGYTILKSRTTPSTHKHSEGPQRGTLANPPNGPDPPEEPWVTPAKQRPEPRQVLTPMPRQSERGELEGGPTPAALRSRVTDRRENSGCEEQHLDPLTSFMVLRRLQRSQTPAHTTLHTTDLPEKSLGKLTAGVDMTGGQQVSAMTGERESSLPVVGKAISKAIQAQASESERRAFWELHAVALPALGRVDDLGSTDLGRSDFSSLMPEDTRFYVKQQEKQLSMGQGRESVCNTVALLHILVTAKELLLRCDLNTATDYLAKAQATCRIAALGQLLRRVQVLQYLSSRREEPRPRHQCLLEQFSTWLNSATCSMILVVTAVENVRAELVAVLSQVSGNTVAEVLPEEGKNKVDSRRVIDSLSCSRCLVVCSQQVDPGFPWWRFTVVLEFDSMGHSPICRLCAENNINYISFSTAAPAAGSESLVRSSPPVCLDNVPFLLFITEGLLKHSDLLQLLESKYNVTLLERRPSECLQRLGATHLYDLITVDEGTAILLQELAELEQDKACERVVMRLSALSLQFTRCWVLLNCTNHEALVCDEVFSNLVLIYSACVLFGIKSEDLDIKVFFMWDVEDVAQCVYQICQHTLLNSETDVQSWLNRDWFSVLPTKEEQCLLQFPCVNCAVAQLMLRRAPSLQWLLAASLSELETTFPEIPHKVCQTSILMLTPVFLYGLWEGVPHTHTPHHCPHTALQGGTAPGEPCTRGQGATAGLGQSVETLWVDQGLPHPLSPG
ncbi:uncharacterized protein shoc1 isoform X2 [Brachyhypopomus gauderio]|uniref:uncharacterized protein shoc1 isoform X2 n=1 Tax=Brachyhypopomus gauderio TaxID=698409 RepID=UPI004042866B